MKTNTKFFISLAILIIASIVSITEPTTEYMKPESLTNVSLIFIILSAFFTGLFFERRKGMEKPGLQEVWVSPHPQSVQPPIQPYPQTQPQSLPPQQLQPVTPQQSPIQQAPEQLVPLSQQLQQLPEEKFTQPIDNVPQEIKGVERSFPSLEDLKKPKNETKS